MNSKNKKLLSKINSEKSRVVTWNNFCSVLSGV